MPKLRLSFTQSCIGIAMDGHVVLPPIWAGPVVGFVQNHWVVLERGRLYEVEEKCLIPPCFCENVDVSPYFGIFSTKQQP